MRKLALGIASVTVVVVSFGVLTAGGVTSKPLVARMSRAPWIFGGGPGVIVTSLRR
jgi:hypothetical protein